jgi:hypothetical protein
VGGERAELEVVTVEKWDVWEPRRLGRKVWGCPFSLGWNLPGPEIPQVVGAHATLKKYSSCGRRPRSAPLAGCLGNTIGENRNCSFLYFQLILSILQDTYYSPRLKNPHVLGMEHFKV